MVGLVDDDCVLRQSLGLEMIQHFADVLVHRRCERTVFTARSRQVLVSFQPFRRALIRIVGCVESPVQQPGTFVLFVDELFATVNHQSRKELSGAIDFLTVVKQVMSVGAIPIEEV